MNDIPYLHEKWSEKSQINGQKIECVPEFNFLGIMLDEFLSWKPHVKKVSSKISRTLGIIKRVRRILPFFALKRCTIL